MTGPMSGAAAEGELHEEQTQYPRESVRDSLFILANIAAVDGGLAFVGRVRNLSAGGMMVEAPAAPGINDRFGIDLRGIGHVTGRVAWARDGKIGFAFDDLIDPRAARKPVSAAAKEPAGQKPFRLF